MSELITQERIAVGSSNLVDELTTRPAMCDHWPGSKGQRSRSQGHVTVSSQNAITRQRMVLSTSISVEIFMVGHATRDTLSRSTRPEVEMGRRSAYPLQKSTEIIVKSRQCRSV